MSELLKIAERVAGWAAHGEEVEAYVARASDTAVRVYDGDVESFSAADTEGVGIRVVAGGRQGFSYAGSLDDEVIADAFAEARDNAGFGTVDDHTHADAGALGDRELLHLGVEHLHIGVARP